MSKSQLPADEESTEQPVADRFPFFLVLLAMFVNGALFCALSGPAFRFWLQDRHFGSELDLYAQGIIPFWSSIIRAGSGILPISVMLAGCFLAGLLLTPIDRLDAAIWARLMNKLRGKEIYFSPMAGMHPDYIPTLNALIMHKPFKLLWEWEFFQMRLQWHLVTNLSIYFLIESQIVTKSPGFMPCILKAIIYLMFLFPALLRSQSMRRVHDYYIDWFRSKRDRSVTTKRTSS
jgi:hypothetical protein